jgi:succinate dehydrogenase/fumarate reductase flavoprotein subunit
MISSPFPVLSSQYGEALLMDAPSPVAVTNAKFSDEADFVIVGFGAAGAAAAVDACSSGLDVLVLEKASGGGGSTAASGGYVYCGGGTRVQKAHGYDDTPNAMYAYLMAVTPEPDAAKIRVYCDNSVAHFDWLEANGVPFNSKYFPGKHVEIQTDETLSYSGNEKVWPYLEKAPPAPRGHKVGMPGSAGKYLIQALMDSAAAKGARLSFDTGVSALIVEDGRVVGVRARRFGETLDIRAQRGVLLATGGFAMNKAMTREFCPFLAREDVHIVGGQWSDGAGVRLGASVGGVPTNMGGVLITSPIYPSERLLKGVLVNRLGKRFVPEDSYHGRTTAMILRQPDQRAWLIIDNSMHARSMFGNQPLVDAWESIAEMEAALGIPKGALQTTLHDYNRHAATGADPEFHKQAEWVQPIGASPPFAALDCSPGRATFSGFTLGGLRTSPDAEVLDAGGAPIPCLYAAGACASNIAQDSIGYSSGVCIGESTYFARRAAAKLASGVEY